jgi:fumarate reductase subunit C
MTKDVVYTEYHPRWLRRPVSTYWWLQRWSYFLFILRELTCLFVAWFVVYLLIMVRAATEGEAAYRGFLTWATSPIVLAANVITFAFVLFHTITFFQAAPRAMVVHIGHSRLPEHLVGIAHYVGLAAVSIVLAWVFLW